MTHIERNNIVIGVAVPLLDLAVLAGGEEVVRGGHEAQRRDGVVVREQRAVAVAEVQPPQLHVAVGAARRHHARVVADVHAQHWQLVPVQR